MAKKIKTQYRCKECSAVSTRWSGRCHQCGAWESLVEEIEREENAVNRGKIGDLSVAPSAAGIMRLGDIDNTEAPRIRTGSEEFDRVLGGGITPGSLILVGGDPGIGKSTLMLQMCAAIERFNPLYITGEESLRQIKLRASRLPEPPESLMLLTETDIGVILPAIAGANTKIAVIDSIQTMYSQSVDSAPGGIVQVRECATALMQLAKRNGIAIFIIGHVTKDGMIAGPKQLEHLVDAVLQFEGDKTYSYRILRAVKNRFGSTNEIGVFEMVEAGLREVPNPSEIFLAQRNREDSGSAIVATVEGTRPLLIEVQALVTPTGYSVPQRSATGFEYRRLQMILAVLEKRLGVDFRHQDVFVNIAGGISLNDPAMDLGVAAAIVSSLRDVSLDSTMVIIGEIGLSGEVRPVPAIDQRLAETQKLGFKTALLPASNAAKVVRQKGLSLVPVERISLAFTQLFK